MNNKYHASFHIHAYFAYVQQVFFFLTVFFFMSKTTFSDMKNIIDLSIKYA